MEMSYPRRKTREVRVGGVTIGGGHPIVVQSMITENTRDVQACVDAIIRLHELGCEIVRVTTPTLADAQSLREIKHTLVLNGVDVPLVADVHHQGTRIAEEVARSVDKVRINPGLFVFQRLSDSIEYTPDEFEAARRKVEEDLAPVIRVCRERDIAMRIGVNHGSLSDRMTVTYGDTPAGMVESALEFIRICEAHDYRNLIVSLKASRVPVMLQANRLMARRMDEEGMDYPLHLGVTEAGDGTLRPDQIHFRNRHAAGRGTGGYHTGFPGGGSGERNPCLLRYPAGVGAAPDQGGVHRLSLLRTYQVQSGKRTGGGQVGHRPSRGSGHCRHGMYRQRSGGNGRCGLRVCRPRERCHIPLPGARSRQDERSAGKRRRGAGRPDQVGRAMGRSLGAQTECG